MESRLLEIFVYVAELGSFSKAAQRLSITPSAVIQQFNRLEDELRVRLLVRTKKGVALTPAGEYMLVKSKKLLHDIQNIEHTLHSFSRESSHIFTLGSSFVRKSRAFYPLWQRFAQASTWNVQIIDVGDIRNTWQMADIIECVHYGGSWQRQMCFTELFTVPIALSARPDLLPADRSFLTWDDLSGKTLVTLPSGLSPVLDNLAREARARGVQVIEAPYYDMFLFSMCEVNDYFLQIPLIWRDLYPSMPTLRCSWDYTQPYGFFCQKNPPAIVEKFLSFVAHERDAGTLDLGKDLLL